MKFRKSFDKSADKNASMAPKSKNGKKPMSKADKVKISVMGVILVTSGLEFAGIPTFSAIKTVLSDDVQSDDDPYAALASLNTQTSSSYTNSALPTNVGPVSNSDNRASNVAISSTPKQSKSTTRSAMPSAQPMKQEKDVPSFVVAPDYRTIIASVQMIQNAMNPDVEKEWVNVRLQLNAEREKNRLAQVKLERVKAQADTATYQKQTSELLAAIQTSQDKSKDVALLNSQDADIEIVTIGNDTVDFIVSGKSFSSRSVNNKVNGMEIVQIDAEKGCAVFKMPSTDLRSVCI